MRLFTHLTTTKKYCNLHRSSKWFYVGVLSNVAELNPFIRACNVLHSVVATSGLCNRERKAHFIDRERTCKTPRKRESELRRGKTSRRILFGGRTFCANFYSTVDTSVGWHAVSKSVQPRVFVYLDKVSFLVFRKNLIITF